ncbi:hypothetical protein [Caulobacter sp. 17J65-9]|uniref:hypothetical protein n=1 Tax=Caulobacter sp. 17J65-9 TaxID=2709382 RepID=UPI0013CCB928|nr:hypothetical protein [Caulobacter sp. 17J65-9]NEX94437.1 hypothetical protein [Caulobacter sp. 17J65-9]
MLPLGVVLAGLFLLLRDAVPLFEAHRTGVVRTRGSRPQKVERASEPDRFAGLVGQRFRSLVGPALLILGGLVWLFLALISQAAQA